MVREIGKRIILIPPFIKGKNYSKKVISPELLKYADKVKFIWESTLKKSLLPEIIPGTNLHRPKEW